MFPRRIRFFVLDVLRAGTANGNTSLKIKLSTSEIFKSPTVRLSWMDHRRNFAT